MRCAAWPLIRVLRRGDELGDGEALQAARTRNSSRTSLGDTVFTRSIPRAPALTRPSCWRWRNASRTVPRLTPRCAATLDLGQVVAGPVAARDDRRTQRLQRPLPQRAAIQAGQRLRAHRASVPGGCQQSPTGCRHAGGHTCTTAMWLPYGSRSMNSSGAPGLHGLRVEVDPAEGAEPGVLGPHVGRLHADAAPAGLAAHRRVQREAGGRSRRGDLQPAGAHPPRRSDESLRTSKPSFSV